MEERRSNSRRTANGLATMSPRRKQENLRTARPSLARGEKKKQKDAAGAAGLRLPHVDDSTLLPLHRMENGRRFIATGTSGSARPTAPTKSPSRLTEAKRTGSKTAARTGFTARNYSR